MGSTQTKSRKRLIHPHLLESSLYTGSVRTDRRGQLKYKNVSTFDFIQGNRELHAVWKTRLFLESRNVTIIREKRFTILSIARKE